MATRPEVLIERWLPVDVIGAESMRERGASSALPPLYFLHVWWARRPLVTSRAAILASLLPAWSEAWPKPLNRQFPNEESYRAWFLRACGILGDPVAGKKLITWAKDKGLKLKTPPYKHSRAFTVSPDEETVKTIQQLLRQVWGDRTPTVLDPFSGGGSIPFEALRYGFTTHANELNPVACTILKATLDLPPRFGKSLGIDIRKYGAQLSEAVENRLGKFFPTPVGTSIHAYLWARTVKCPYTGKPIPLSPNWWLKKNGEPVAAHPVFPESASRARFEIVVGRSAVERARPDSGTIKDGDAISPWAQNQAVDGDYIKAEAQAGRMGDQLIALALKRHTGVEFVVPTSADLEAIEAAGRELDRRRPAWEASGLVPSESITEISNYDRGHRLYGIQHWSDAFAPRQLLTLCTYLEELNTLKPAIRAALAVERAEAVLTYLGLALDKAAFYNCRLGWWNANRLVCVPIFDRHGYTFRWSYAEFDGAKNLFPWVTDQVAEAYESIAELATSGYRLLQQGVERKPAILTTGSASALGAMPDRSILHICTDPPYEANVMYAECSDFFYVWMKRSLGDVHPALFADALTNKDDEAVANEARFRDLGKKKKQLALNDYQRKMLAAFREMHRVLADDGVLTVMFTHKKVAAWDSLATALIEAGFAIHSSWPVHTESEHSLHQAKKNAAQSTILLACRKRTPSTEPVWWDDLKALVRRTAREKAEEFERLGIRGVDLYIATFGPTLAILSERWPVLTSEADERTGEPKPLRPEVALDLAREEVVNLRKQGLLLGRKIQFDPVTDWYLMAWDAFKAAEFPADEARKLALALGLDLEKQLILQRRLLTKKGSTVVLQLPKDRRRKGVVDPELESFPCVIDAVHTAMLVLSEDGSRAAEAFLKHAGLLKDPTFKACVQALLNAVPRTKLKGRFARPEAQLLEELRMAFFDDLVPPADEEPRLEPAEQFLGHYGKTLEPESDDEGEAEDDEEGDE